MRRSLFSAGAGPLKYGVPSLAVQTAASHGMELARRHQGAREPRVTDTALRRLRDRVVGEHGGQLFAETKFGSRPVGDVGRRTTTLRV